MDKGIRINVNAKFSELLVERNASTDKDRNKKFRRDVMTWAIDEFGITVASAATHYNHALKLAQTHAPASVEGLGRPEDKKGGRKRKAVAETAGDVKQNGEDEHVFTTVEPATFVVKKKRDNTVVAEGLTLAQAQALVEGAAAAKKAKLFWE